MGKQLAVNVDKAKWSGLSRGTSQLIEARGIGRYKDPFDLGMLESQLSYIVCQHYTGAIEKWAASLTIDFTHRSFNLPNFRKTAISASQNGGHSLQLHLRGLATQSP